MRRWLLSGFLVSSVAALGQPPAVPEREVYELANSILDELHPQALTWYKRVADGKYQWKQLMPNTTPDVRLLLLDQQGANWCQSLLCSFGADSAQSEWQLRQHFSSADLTYMQQQIPAANRFVFSQANIRQAWVRVVSIDTIKAMVKRLGTSEWILGDSILQRFGDKNIHHISRLIFTRNHRRALVTVGDDYNGYTVAIYHKTGSVWRREQELVTVAY